MKIIDKEKLWRATVASSKFLENLEKLDFQNDDLTPEIIVTANAEFDYDWDYAPRRTLSIRIDETGKAYWAYLSGYESQHGVFDVSDDIPSEIVNLLREWDRQFKVTK
jgi:hypothetical protein